MKIKLEDLKRAVQWIEANSRDVTIDLQKSNDDRTMNIKCTDKYEVSVEIKLFDSGTMGPRIIKEDTLK